MTDAPKDDNRKIDIVAGLEMNCTNRTYAFDIAKHPGGIEVLLSRNGEPRRMALCTHENDAQTIVDALRYAQEMGVI